ncbi:MULTISPECIES: ketopantoate reductase family protein [unclassified Lentimonas]|uniref:ketopantoate reductase family protein n=1 Tax=unclassified Lentimonas TaxID=2630993 RepID=UPI0013257A39|nr:MULTISPECIES: 2-dehydropantoate 2-reductase [unclassified Lentimonas]CAA6691389.1 2-dehydropantoate 2-reductase (EC [Lentimonas sp. CC10]CAA6693129.1 2-dehydropantoate 2-reductase (EC [Lentimonas sp. CC19]CAA7068989.1 2-dehydropantoate 2-reductase (EC [Lentimonas sp. CC11]
MKIGIIGAGALGGYYGAKLALAGHAVHLIARGATLKAIQERGLTVQRDDSTLSVTEIHATDDASTVGVVNLVIVATKSYHLDSIGSILRALKGPQTIVLPLQNGIDSAERLSALTEPEGILGGLTYLPATVSALGVVRQQGEEKPILLGALNASDETAAETATAVLHAAGIAVEHNADIRVALWMKFILTIGTMGVQSVAGQGFGETREDPDTRALYFDCMGEVAVLAKASGITLPADTQAQLMAKIDSYPAVAKASMLQDLERGRPLELDAMHGTVVRLGKTLGVPTPANQFIYSTLKSRAVGGG